MVNIWINGGAEGKKIQLVVKEEKRTLHYQVKENESIMMYTYNELLLAVTMNELNSSTWINFKNIKLNKENKL